MTDEEFKSQLMQQTLSPERFDHHGHLRFAWIVLNEYELYQAIAAVGESIKRYANALGAADKYHETLTRAFTMIIFQRQSQGHYHSFNAFLAANQDLLLNAKSVLAQYYSEECLLSPDAKVYWIEPDRKSIL